MNRLHTEPIATAPDADWMPFPGGELEGERPKAVCRACRDRHHRTVEGHAAAARSALCFQCYRDELDRQRRLKAAADLDTASDARFQTCLPFEPVNSARLASLKAERAAARVAARQGIGATIERRRKAQIEARHALARVLQGLKHRQMLHADMPAHGRSASAATARAAALQLPESWLPFVVGH